MSGVRVSHLGPKETNKLKQACLSLFYPTNNITNAVLERIFKEIRSIFHTKSKYQTVSGEYKALI